MATFLFESTVFGPVISRRYGISLGINLLPNNRKLCSFDCIYCECGLNSAAKGAGSFPKADEVKRLLEDKLLQLAKENSLPDVITFAGNGEPTLHPEFYQIILDTIEIRNAIAPRCDITVLSNATQTHSASVRKALMLVENNILKLDSATDETFALLNRPTKPTAVESVIDGLMLFEGELIVQTLFCRGVVNGEKIDNTTEHEIDEWISALQRINPKKVSIYSISRDTPFEMIEKIERQELERIAARAKKSGLTVEIS